MTASWQVQPTALGTYPWSNIPSRVFGPLKLIAWRKPISIDQPIIVKPDLRGSGETSVSDLPQGARPSIQGSGTDIHHIREYRPGDPIHTIDWKATARTEQLTTRVFAEEQSLEIMLVVDAGRTSRTEMSGLSQFAHYANLACRFALHATQRGDSVGMIVVADKLMATLPPRTGNTAVTNIRETLAQLNPTPMETDLVTAALHLQKTVRHRCLVVLLTDIYGQAIEGAFGRSLSVWQRKHLPIIVSCIDPDLLEQKSTPATVPSQVYKTLATNEYLNVVNTNADAAGRMGAHCIVARPSQLEQKVLDLYEGLRANRRV